MPFRVAARTILQLGAELISSDAVAFDELIKNAFDARSKRVEIGVVVRVPYARYHELLSREIEAQKTADLQRIRSDLLDAIDRTAPEVSKLEKTVLSAETLSDLQTALVSANYIEVRDTGCGMSLDQLQTVYLTIGTRSKLIEAETAPADAPPILGEKGLGRLSTMRLGTRLRVRTTRAGEKHWNKLDIDWEMFSNASDQMIEEVPITTQRGARKDDPAISGTNIFISGLLSEWSEEQLRDIGRLEFSRLNDPFIPEKKYRVTLRYNGEVIPIPPVNKLLFKHADATLEADVDRRDGAFELHGSINYSYRNRRLPLYVSEDHLINLAELTSKRDLKRLGPFSVKLYWFNRRRLTAIEGIGDTRQVRAVLDTWGGGLMLFRDGFRVNPYGGPSDDWLQLDPAAFRSAGYKINRKQIIGKVEITRRANPYLVDQTNREGLRDNPEKRGLISILQHILGRLREFTNRVDAQLRAQEALSLDLLEERVERTEEDLKDTLRDFAARHPTEKGVTEALRALADHLRDAVEETKDLAKNFENRHTQLVNLAALGLMVEIVVHELNRATQNTLATLASAERSDLPRGLQGTFETLEAQLRTLQKRLKSLDPVGTAGRQHKETFELSGWIREIVENHEPQFKRHNIDWSVESVPKNSSLTVKAVRGMIVEILENLISNSVYWLKWQKARDSSFKPKIDVKVDTKKRTVSFSDNGPGVEPDRREDIFYAFITTKPSREGKGLGLYISREIAKYNEADLFLSDKSTVRPDRLNTFVLQLGPQ